MTTYNENGVPELFRGPDAPMSLSPEAYARVRKARDAHLRAADPSVETEDTRADHEITGTLVLVQNPDPDKRDFATFNAGAETHDEFIASVIGAFDQSHVGTPGQPGEDVRFRPLWVSSTDPAVAKDLADYYSKDGVHTCEVRDIAEVLS